MIAVAKEQYYVLSMYVVLLFLMATPCLSGCVWVYAYSNIMSFLCKYYLSLSNLHCSFLFTLNCILLPF